MKALVYKFANLCPEFEYVFFCIEDGKNTLLFFIYQGSSFYHFFFSKFIGLTIHFSAGDYTIKMWIRHPKYEVLDKLQALQFIISRKQPNINLSFYTTHALVSERTFKSTSLAKGEMTHMFVSPIAEDKLPKQYTSGSYLSGKISFIGNEPGKSCSSYPLKYHLGPLCISPKKDSATAATSNEKPVKEKSYPEFIKEAKLSYLQKTATTINAEDAVKMYEELVYEFANDLNVHIAFTTYLGKYNPVVFSMKYLIISLYQMSIQISTIFKCV